VGFGNFEYLFGNRFYRESFLTTAVFSVLVTVSAMSFALWLAVLADRVIKGSGAYRTLLIWPYAVAPAIAGVLWLFMFNPFTGIIAWMLSQMGYAWNHNLDGGQAMALVVAASAWKQISYNFLFFLAGLQAIPKSVIEAAAIDGASFWRRFWTIVFPLLSPTTFFLLVVNVVYAFFDTFGVIHTITQGGPQQSTTILVYKVFADGFVGQDLGSSAAQSVVLMVLVTILTVVQFRFIERRVHY
jgi:sn-glycerol 3-phosphate transport system permease protein